MGKERESITRGKCETESRAVWRAVGDPGPHHLPVYRRAPTHLARHGALIARTNATTKGTRIILAF
jgi:hypothetical protein